jgi:hypothetical protein
MHMVLKNSSMPVTVVCCVCSHLFCGHKGCSLPEVSVTDYRWNWLSHLQKKATKPSPFEIIPLQTTTGKENKWKTQEALAQAAVTLETERIKGSNP